MSNTPWWGKGLLSVPLYSSIYVQGGVVGEYSDRCIIVVCMQYLWKDLKRDD